MGIENILIVDDELVIRHSLQEILRRLRYRVATASNLEEATAKMEGEGFDVVFLDLRLPDGSGTELLERLMTLSNPPVTIMITGHGSIESAVDCMRAGAFDYVLKPLAMDHVRAILKKAESFERMASLNRYYTTAAQEEQDFLGNSPAMVRLKNLIRKVAATEATVLVTGENGTGKELVGREIYRLSERSDKPYIRVNCAAVSENLIESEFFGHEKGAFTGALQKREGRFELAHTGTLLLDEIGEISPGVQVKLLRVLQEREFERVGGNKTIQVDVRVVATTNRNLLAAVRKGDFREDLYYRLNVFPLHIPPLRERPGDILLLATAFLRRFSRKHGINPAGFSPEAMEMMERYPWPGNVRELQNTLERAVILSSDGDPITTEALCLPVAGPTWPVEVSVGHTPGPSAPATTSAGGGVGAVSSAAVGRRETGVRPDRGTAGPFAGSPGGGTVPPVGVSAPTERSAQLSLPILPDPGPEEPSPVETQPAGVGGGNLVSLEEVEKQHILRALEAAGGNRKEASDLLGISDRTLRTKLQKYREEGLDIP